MSNTPELERFLEISWRRPLTEAEQAELEAFLKANPTAREEWETEVALTGAMDGLADPPISSNFTARVLQAIEREDRAVGRAVLRDSWWRRLAHPTAVAWSGSLALLLVVGGVLLHQRQHALARQDVEVLAKTLPALPNTEVLTNFEAIRAMSLAPAPDEKLLAAMQ